MQLEASSDVTWLFRRWSEGDQEALNHLVALMYVELRWVAHHRLRHERANRALNATELVHAAYLKLIHLRSTRFHNRAHFLAMASRIMRRLLVDQARARCAAKRGGEAEEVELDEALCASVPRAEALTQLDEAMQRLDAIDPRQRWMLEQRYFGGLSLEEIAGALDVSLATVKRELRFAHAWLAAALRVTRAPNGSGARRGSAERVVLAVAAPPMTRRHSAPTAPSAPLG